jgi:hypothetical protein
VRYWVGVALTLLGGFLHVTDFTKPIPDNGNLFSK